MTKLSFFKRRQFLLVGGTGAVSFLGGVGITKAIDVHASSSIQQSKGPTIDNQPYLSPSGFDQRFLAKSADIRQIWDFVTIEQVQPQGLVAVRNALNAFQFIYNKSFYPIICLRGNAAIYALDDTIWMKYGIGNLYNSPTNSNNGNPVYSRHTATEGISNFEDISQDSSLQGLLQRGAHLVVCHDALNSISMKIAKQHRLSIASAYNELESHLVSGAQQTPSGSSLIAVAQHLGFTYAKQ